jgi:hypothetical protein
MAPTVRAGVIDADPAGVTWISCVVWSEVDRSAVAAKAPTARGPLPKNQGWSGIQPGGGAAPNPGVERHPTRGWDDTQLRRVRHPIGAGTGTQPGPGAGTHPGRRRALNQGGDGTQGGDGHPSGVVTGTHPRRVRHPIGVVTGTNPGRDGHPSGMGTGAHPRVGAVRLPRLPSFGSVANLAGAAGIWSRWSRRRRGGRRPGR